MSAGDLQTGRKRKLSADERKHLLLVACTVDRLDLVAALKRPPAAVRVITGLRHLPWLDLAGNLVIGLLPRKLRFLATAWRFWRRARR